MSKTDWATLKQLTELKFLRQSQKMQKLMEEDLAHQKKFETLRSKLVEGSKQSDMSSSMAVYERNKELWFHRGLQELKEINQDRVQVKVKLSQQRDRVAFAYGQDSVVDKLAKDAKDSKGR